MTLELTFENMCQEQNLPPQDFFPSDPGNMHSVRVSDAESKKKWKEEKGDAFEMQVICVCVCVCVCVCMYLQINRSCTYIYVYIDRSRDM